MHSGSDLWRAGGGFHSAKQLSGFGWTRVGQIRPTGRVWPKVPSAFAPNLVGIFQIWPSPVQCWPTWTTTGVAAISWVAPTPGIAAWRTHGLLLPDEVPHAPLRCWHIRRGGRQSERSCGSFAYAKLLNDGSGTRDAQTQSACRVLPDIHQQCLRNGRTLGVTRPNWSDFAQCWPDVSQIWIERSGHTSARRGTGTTANRMDMLTGCAGRGSQEALGRDRAAPRGNSIIDMFRKGYTT